MALAPGVRLGPYEIVSPAGAGGMGEVYRARDTRLGRTVAIKVLPADFATDPDRRARFTREARVISSLSHPHICTLYDVGHEGGIDFLVLEYLEGETLADRLQRGRVPLPQALEIASQIAAGLHEAHAAGVVHRDLKPANVMLTRSGARLLDFGLARPRPADAPAEGGATRSILTAEHTLVGTMPYMAPEQLQASDVDARADIFSFGVVLYELVTGRRPFEGDAPATLIAAILEKDPAPISTHVADVPRAVERLVQQCLIKTRDQRWQSARDLELQLSTIRAAAGQQDAVVPSSSRRRVVAGAAAAVVLLALGIAFGAGLMRGRTAGTAAAAPRVHFTIPLAPGESIHEHNSSSIALAADGSRIAFAVNRRDGSGVYLRDFDSPAATWIAGTGRASNPFFSPDGKSIAFESGGSLKTLEIGSSTPMRLCDVPYFAGGSWGRDGIVLVPSFTSGLFLVSATGGQLRRLTSVDISKGERAHIWPQVLPDGRVLFTIWTGGDFDQARLALLTPSTGTYTVVLEGAYHGRYSNGRLIYAKDTRLLSVPFDPDAGRATGTPARIADGVAGDAGGGAAMFAVDGRGTLAYVPGVPRPISRALVRVDPKGSAEVISDTNRSFVAVRMSPDGRRLAVWLEEAAAAIWLKDVSRDPLTRITFSGDDHSAVWSPDGRRIAFESGRASTHHLFVRHADGSGDERQITTGDHHQYVNDWSPKDDRLVYTEYHPDTGADLWIVNVDGTPQPRRFRATPFAEKHATFSPDGKWIAYVANDSSTNEVYVEAAGGGGRTQISSGGGDEPAWSRSGDRLFYRTGSRMMAVPVTIGETFTAGRPTVLFEGMYHYNISPNRTYDVMSDGRFIMISLPDAATTPRQIDVVLNRVR